MVIQLLVNDEKLPNQCRPHKLMGNFIGQWECHIAPDWLLIYQYNESEIVLLDTGTHADLFRQ